MAIYGIQCEGQGTGRAETRAQMRCQVQAALFSLPMSGPCTPGPCDPNALSSWCPNVASMLFFFFFFSSRPQMLVQCTSFSFGQNFVALNPSICNVTTLRRERIMIQAYSKSSKPRPQPAIWIKPFFRVIKSHQPQLTPQTTKPHNPNCVYVLEKKCFCIWI